MHALVFNNEAKDFRDEDDNRIKSRDKCRSLLYKDKRNNASKHVKTKSRRLGV